MAEAKEKKNIKRIRTPRVYQVEASECGAACLSIIMQYYHCYVPMEELRYQCGVSRDGSNAADLIRAAGVFGLKGSGYSKSLKDMRNFPVPCILHWNFNHFVVLEGIHGDKVYLNDPATGRRRVTMKEMDECFTGIVLSFQKTENFKRIESPNKLLALVKERLSGQQSALAYLLLTGLLLVFPGMFLPTMSRIFIDDVVMNGSTYWLRAVLLGLTVAYLFQILFNWIRLGVLARLQLHLNMSAAAKLFYHLFRLPIPFYDQRYTGELAQRIENSSEVNNFLAGNLMEAVLNVLEAMFYLIVMVLYSPFLTAIGVTGVAVNILFTFMMMKPLADLAMKQQQDRNRLTGHLCAGLSIFSTIRANGAEDDYAAEIIGNYAKMTESEQRMGRAQQLLSAVPGSLSSFFSILILLIGGGLVIRGYITAGVLTAFCQLLASFTAPVNKLIGFSRNIQTMKANMFSIDDIESATSDRRFLKENDEKSRKPLMGKVQMNNVTFTYNPGLNPAVKSLSFSAAPGSRIGITGESGCGKSTTAKLLAGLLHPQSGNVLYDGIPISGISPEALRACFSMISQNSFFFSGTIRENLTFWKNDCPEQDIIAALKDAEAYEMVNAFPDGLEYSLREGGSNLSGGQRQKLQIARALLFDPSILIMDEATSALDPVTEKKIMDNISRRNCTCLIIAHRLSTIRDCDMILVMDKGSIVQYGTHDQLMEKGGIYRRLLVG